MPDESTVPDCAFCAIAAGSVRPSYEVMRRDDVIAFFPQDPAALGHTLVIPQAHLSNFMELDGAAVSQVLQTCQAVAVALRRALGAEGISLISSAGAAAGQTVFHVHFHLVPRWQGDAMGDIWPRNVGISQGALDEAQRLVLAELSG